MQCTKLKTYMETGRVVFLPPSRITPNPAQPRKFFSQESLQELADSIRIHGILQPLSVRKMESHYELIAGERRYRAAQLAGLREIPCIVMRMDEQESSLTALLENLQRQDLNYIEEAKAFSALMSRFSMSQEQVAKAVGKSQSAVCNTLRLLQHSQPVLTKLLEHDLTQRHARALLKLPDEGKKLSAIAHIARNRLSVSQTEQYIDKLLRPSSVILSEALSSFLCHPERSIEDAKPKDPSLPKEKADSSTPLRLRCAPLRVAQNDTQQLLANILHTIDQSGLPITVTQEETPTHTVLTLHLPK